MYFLSILANLKFIQYLNNLKDIKETVLKIFIVKKSKENDVYSILKNIVCHKFNLNYLSIFLDKKVNMIKIFIILSLVSLNIFLNDSAPIIKTLYVLQKHVSSNKSLQYPLYITNNYGKLLVDTVYFIENENYICPAGSMRFAYKDQEGRFRVASSKLDEKTIGSGVPRAKINRKLQRGRKKLHEAYSFFAGKKK